MDLWVTEKQTPNLAISLRVKKTLCEEKSQYQEICVVDTYQFGRVLLLDGVIQTTERDEFIYHEMIVHVPMFSHPNPRHVLVVGGGDGGTVREVLKHGSVVDVTLVEIDEKVIEVSKRFLPTISCALDDPRVTIHIDDGIKFMERDGNNYDVIIIDSTDPVGAAAGLFTADFYANVHKRLSDDGLCVAQTESLLLDPDFVHRIRNCVSQYFAITRVYSAPIPTYPGGLWSFTIGSKVHDPCNCLREKEIAGTKYYSRGIHRACFELPQFLEDLKVV